MFSIELPLTAVVQSFDEGTFLEEALLFPEVRCLGDKLPGLQRTVKNLLIRTVLEIPPFELHRRRLPGGADAGSVTLTVSPAVRSIAWQEPVTLHFPVVRWNHPAPQVLSAGDGPPVPEAFLAYVPALDIEVFVPRADRLEELLEEQIRTTLLRTKAHALQPLVWLQRCREIQVERLTCSIELKTPKQLAREESERDELGKPVMPEVCANLTKEPLRPGYELDGIIAMLLDTLTGAPSRSVLLVGPSGVGKTAAVHELVRRRTRVGLAATPFWATTGSRLVSGMCGFGMWQERCTKLIREASRERAILHLGNLLELMEVGKSEHQSQGVASFLRPYLTRGDLLAVGECTPEQLPLIERQEPQLLAAFVQIPAPEPTRSQTRIILESFVKDASHGNQRVTADGIDQLDRLHRRYATYSAFPGRPLRFLSNLLADRGPDCTLSAKDVTREFSRESGLPLSLLEDSEPLHLGQTRDWFAKRVIGQKESVDLVLDVLATVKAALTRPRRPVASLMFIGPTGVGKTEMAKALAEFVFGSTSRLTRFDMSEYADPDAVVRLIGGSFHGEGLLTARIREQPFSVLLLDEIEKAHPALFDLLLQVLGEGRLSDTVGRVADFCNSVIIMTSNLGADAFQRGGFGLRRDSGVAGRARQHFLDAVQRFFRPELFNRIDAIIPFAPLDDWTILQIAGRQLDLIRQRDGLRFRSVHLDIDTDVAAWLADRGMDIRYGARSLKRAMDRLLLAPLADKLNSYLVDTPLKVQVTAKGDALQVHAKFEMQDAHHEDTRPDAEAVADLQGLRRDLQRLLRSSSALEMDNEIHRLRFLELRASKGIRLKPDEIQRISRLASWREIRADLDQLFIQTCDLEDHALLGLLGYEPFDSEAIKHGLNSARAALEKILLKLYLRRFDKPDNVIVAIFSEQPAFLLTLGEAYFRIVGALGGQSELWQFRPGDHSRDKDGNAPLERRLVLEPAMLWAGKGGVLMRTIDPKTKLLLPEERVARPMQRVVGLGLAVRAPAALPRLISERGLHVFRTAQSNGTCLVDTTECTFQEYEPPAGMDRRGNIGRQERRRTYDFARGVLEDERLTGNLYANADNLPMVLGSALEQVLAQSVKAIIDS